MLCMGERNGAYRVLAWKSEGKRPLVGHTGFLFGNLRERGHLEDTSIDWILILNGSSGSGMVRGMDWMDLAEDRDKWQALVNVVMNLQIS